MSPVYMQQTNAAEYRHFLPRGSMILICQPRVDRRARRHGRSDAFAESGITCQRKTIHPAVLDELHPRAGTCDPRVRVSIC